MSDLIVNTVVLPLGLGLVAGLLALGAGRQRLALWLVALVLVGAVVWRLEGFPPFPPVASKHRLAYALAALMLLAPLVTALPRLPRILAGIALLAAALAYIGMTKLFAAAAWPGALLLLPLPVLLGAGLGLLGTARPAPDDFYAPRLALLLTAIGGAVIALIGGFVGMGQLSGALAAAIGGTLIVAYGAQLAGRPGPSGAAHDAANWLFGAVLAAILIIVTLFAPTPDPVAMLVLALTPLSVTVMPRLVGIDARLRPILFGFVAALPAAAAVLIAYLTSLTGG